MISKMYRSYITQKTNNKSTTTTTNTSQSNITFYDFSNGNFSEICNFNNVLSNFYQITKNGKILIEDEDDDGNDYNNCSADSCHIV